jgi:dihydrofolate reductase
MINAIFAIDSQGGIGKDGSLPWPYDAEDMKWFVTNTKHQIIVMGSKTWQDPNMPTPLLKRINVVISSSPIEAFPGADYVMNVYDLHHDFDLIIQDFPDKDIWIIGGARVLNSTRHLIQEAYITHFDNQFDCDIKLDINNWLREFKLSKEIPGSGKTFRIYTR